MHGELTGRERQVAALAATGRTNREIGEALGLSAKTVEWHLSRVLRKLELRSRVELAARVGALRSQGSPVGPGASTNEPFGRLSRPQATDINSHQRWGR